MEIIVRIERQDGLLEREYTNRQGERKLFASVGFVLLHGSNRIYAYAGDELARALSQNKPDNKHYYLADLEFDCRDVSGDKGVRSFTDIRIRKLNIL